jgi:predicted Zn-dependent peptidase
LSIAKTLIHRNKNLVIAGNFPIDIENHIKDSIAFKEIYKIKLEEVNKIRKNENLPLIDTQIKSICTTSLKTQQVILLLGKATINYNNEADILLRLISCYLGYGMSSLLFKVLREKYGVVYEAGIYHPIRENKTPFIMHASTTEEKAVLTLNLLKECWEKVIETDISDEELDLLKMKYKGQIAHSLQSISQRAEHKAHLLGIGLTKDYDKKNMNRLESINSKDIRDAANIYLKKPSLSVCSNKEVIQRIRNNWNK